MSRNARTIFLYKFGSEHCGEKRSVSATPSVPAAEARSAGAGPRGCRAGACLPAPPTKPSDARRPRGATLGVRRARDDPQVIVPARRLLLWRLFCGL